MVLDAEQHGGRDFHQRVVGGLLLLAACVPIVQIVDLVSYLWGRGGVGTDHGTVGKGEDGGIPHNLEGVFKQQFTCVDSGANKPLFHPDYVIDQLYSIFLSISWR